MISLPYPEPADRLPRISLPEGTTGGESMAPVGSCVSATTEPNGSSSSASETPQPPPPPARTSSFSTTNTRTATPATSRQPGAPPSLTQSLAQQLAQSPQTGPYIPVSSLIKPDAIYLGPTANPSLPAFDAAGTDWKPPPPLPGARKIVRKASTVDGTPAPVMVPGTGSPTNTGTPQGHRRRPSKRATVSGVVVPDAVAAAAATKVPGGLQRTPTFSMAPTSAAATTSPTTTLHALPTPTLPLSVQTLTTAAAPATGPPTPATPPLPPPHPALLAAAAAVPPPPYLYYLQHQAPAGATPAASRQYSGLSADGYEGALSEFLVGGMLPATALDLGGGGGSGWMFSGASEDSGQPQQQQAYNPQGIFGVAGTTGTAAAAMAAEAGGPSGPGGDGGFAGAAAPLAWQ